jgi:energy-converting hydrogenase Eha subunit A
MLWLAGLFFLAIRKIAQKWKKKSLWFLPPALLTLAVFTLAYAPLPFGWGTLAETGATVAKWVLGWIGGLIGVSAQAIAGILLALVLVFGLHDLIKDHKPDKWAKTAIYALPVLALSSSGPIAQSVLHVTQMISGVGPTVVAAVAG